MTDVIGTEQVAKATALLQRYKTGKDAAKKEEQAKNSKDEWAGVR